MEKFPTIKIRITSDFALKVWKAELARIRAIVTSITSPIISFTISWPGITDNSYVPERSSLHQVT